MNLEKIKYQKAKISNVSDIVLVHENAFKFFFLTSLGKGFLKTYYEKCIREKDVIAIVAVNEKEKVIGFAIGNLKSKGFYKKLLINNFSSFFLQALIIFFKKPNAIYRLIKNFTKLDKKKVDDGEYSELLSIGIDTEEKGQGIGKQLLIQFEKKIKDKKSKKIALTTDFYDNEYALSFYKKLGYDVYYTFTAYPKRKMYKLIKRI